MTGRALGLLGDLPEWPENPRPHGEDVFASTSRLCLECGLCCTGALFSYVALTAEEITSLAATPIRPYTQAQPGKGEDDDRLGMEQPCNCHRDGHCSIFPDRPDVCRSYSCELLKATMNGRVGGVEALKIATRTKAQFEWLKLAAKKFGYLSMARPSLEAVLRDFCTRMYSRAKSAPLHAHESEFARNLFEYFQNVDRYFERSDNLAPAVNIVRELDAPKPGFEVPREQIDRLTFGAAGQIMELRNCSELIEPLSSITRGWNIRPDGDADDSPAAIRIWRIEGRYYWDMPYPGPFGGFDEPLTDPLHLLDQLYKHIEEFYSLENPAHFYLRSAAVEIDNKLILLFGKGKTENTTLAMILASRGHRVFADSRIAVDTETSHCFSIGVVPRLQLPLSDDKGARKASLLAKENLGPHSSSFAFVELPERLLAPKGTSNDVSGLISLEWSGQPIDTTLQPTNNAETLKAVIPLHYGGEISARRAFTALHKNVREAESFVLRYADAEDAADAIENKFYHGSP